MSTAPNTFCANCGLHYAEHAGERCPGGGDSWFTPVPQTTHMWKVVHIAEGGASHTQFVIADSNAAAMQHMNALYGLPRFCAALRKTPWSQAA